MTTAARQPKPNRKGPDPAPRRPSAWTGARASPTFSPGASPARLPQSSAPGAFPPLGPPNGPPKNPDTDRVLQSIAGLTGTTITLVTKTGSRFEGVVLSTTGEGDTTGLTLKDAKDLSSPGQPLKPTHFIASTNIDTWSSGPAGARPTNGDTFKTDTDISQKAPKRERELQAWQPDADGLEANGNGHAHAGGAHADDVTFGAGASRTTHAWDQFATNEQLFGVKTAFDEDVYTTKLDRSAPDFKERERKAQQLANEIMGGASSNPHIAEERIMNTVDDSGVNEEDKYGAVVRNPNAYVPPGARKTGPSDKTAPAAAVPVPKVSVNAPDGSQEPVQTPSKSSSPTPAAKPPADPLPAFRDFVTNERQRLTQKRQALVKNDMERRMADLVKFSQSFKLNKPIPEDLVPILAKDTDKQKQIREKASKDASSGVARVIAVPSSTPTIAPSPSAVATAAAPASKAAAKAALQASASSKAVASAGNGAAGANKTSTPASAPSKDAKIANGRISMFIQPIPAFRGGKKPSATPPAPSTSGSASGSNANSNANAANAAANAPPLSPTSARLNVNASSFRPNPKAVAFNPVVPSSGPDHSPASASPKPSKANESPQPQQPQQPNPFFGTRVIKKTPPVSIRDDFNPFKYNKVAEASAVGAMWPYQGKRYMLMFPPVSIPPTQPQASPHMAPPQPQPIPQPTQYEEDPAQAAARAGYVYAYPPYGYPGAPMMQGMPPPGPPGAYMPGPYMQAMPYPPGMPPPNGQPMYASPSMGQMPPPGAYMAPPPGAYPPPNGGGPRPSMPPTPIPAHAHPYYQPSPQMQHAVPYPMMMAPPGQGPHGYETGPPPVPMGGHA